MRFATMVLVVLVCSRIAHAQTGRVSVHVTDFDTGSAVTNAEVHAGFNTSIKPGWGWGGGKPNNVKGTTSANGMCTLTGSGNGGSVGIGVRKDGYYGSGGYEVSFTNVSGSVEREWRPRNPTVHVALKRVVNPVAMYAKNMGSVHLPVTGEPIGFDLREGDWVAPHGSGKTEDLILTYVKNPDGFVRTRYGDVKTYDFSLTVDFTNDGDGFVVVEAPLRARSSLRLPRIAPEQGYQAPLSKRVHRGQDMKAHSDIRQDVNYFLRVRTKKDEKGEIISALYGKIHGDFVFDHNGELTFTYYLNPEPNDRNVEFDPEKNLFGRLSARERVRQP